MPATYNNTSNWVKWTARFGLIAKGVVYCLSGLLALMAAMHLGNNSAKDAGVKGVFSFVEHQPLGKWILIIVALGLTCFTIWRFIQAFKDTEHKGANRKGLSKRVAYFSSGIAYGGITVYAYKTLFGAGSSGGNAKEGWAEKLLSQPHGQWMVGIVAAIMICTGLFQLYRAISGKYKKYVRTALDKDTAPWIGTAGVAGYAARGIVWLIIGWLFIKAALHSNPKEAGGNEDAFEWLQDSTYGSLLLGSIALGLICYGGFMFLRARYQAIHTA